MLCPLLKVEVPCSPGHPLCVWCSFLATREQGEERAVRGRGKMKVCLSCNRPFIAACNRQQYCLMCKDEQYKAGSKARWKRFKDKCEAKRKKRRTSHGKENGESTLNQEA